MERGYSVFTGKVTRKRGVDMPVSKMFEDRKAAFEFARQCGTGEVTEVEHLGGKHWKIVRSWPVPSIREE